MGLARNITHTGQEEFQPCFPAAMFTDFLEQPVIGGSVRLQIEAEIEKRFFENTLFAKVKCNQEPAETAIAVEKGMHRLELNMRKARLDDRGQAAVLLMEEAFKIAHQIFNKMWGWRHEQGISRPRSADPVL